MIIKLFFIISLSFRVICGITEDTQQYHIIRAALEAVCFQTRDILEAMVKDSGTKLMTLQVDGGMTVNNLLMQLQADLTGISVGIYKYFFVIASKLFIRICSKNIKIIKLYFSKT